MGGGGWFYVPKVRWSVAVSSFFALFGEKTGFVKRSVDRRSRIPACFR